MFVLGVFIAACVTNNHFMKLTALVFFVGLAVLAIPTYMSGDGATSALADNPRFAHDLVDTHRNWSYAALAAIGITGIAALVSLWRYWSGGKISDQALNTLFWLAVITLVLMAVAGELGWEINHTELRLDPAAQKTSQVWSHFHMILNHFPTVGFVIALTYYIIALIKNDVTMRRTGLVLLVVCAILGVPTYVTGNASMWALTDPLVPGISKALINEHRDMALLTLFGLAFTGVDRLDRGLALSASRPLLQQGALSRPGVLPDHARHHGRDRPSRRPDQSSGDSARDRSAADRRCRELVSRHRTGDQPRHVVRAMADRAFLRLLLRLRHRARGGAARAGLLEIRVVRGRAPDPSARRVRRG